MWKKVLREYFSFSRKERRGIWFLFILLLLLMVYRIIEYKFYSKENYLSYQIIIQDELQKVDKAKQKTAWLSYRKNTTKKRKLYFNYLQEQDLIDIGISKRDAKILINKRANGLKIFSIDDLDQLKIEDTLVLKTLKERLTFLPRKKYFQTEIKVNQALSSNVKININEADSNALEQLRGIGMGTAKRIVKYRDRLGGFISLEQIKEIWGMDSAGYEHLLKQVYTDAAIHKLNINNADVSTLAKHPYIGYSLAKLIVNYRLQHGKYNEPRDLFNIHVMNEKIFSKIEPYISTSDD